MLKRKDNTSSSNDHAILNPHDIIKNLNSSNISKILESCTLLRQYIRQSKDNFLYSLSILHRLVALLDVNKYEIQVIYIASQTLNDLCTFGGIKMIELLLECNLLNNSIIIIQKNLIDNNPKYNDIISNLIALFCYYCQNFDHLISTFISNIDLLSLLFNTLHNNLKNHADKNYKDLNESLYNFFIILSDNNHQFIVYLLSNINHFKMIIQQSFTIPYLTKSVSLLLMNIYYSSQQQQIVQQVISKKISYLN